MQRAVSPNASIKFRNDTHRPVSRFSSVTSATPAKRITFFKSGDIQFSGVRKAIHKRSFKCFDALLDDLSQKVPLPFGVRTITTPRGTHSIQHLEQLEDGGCYVCSDRRYVKPVDLEAAGRRPAIWHHSHPHSTRKKPARPEDPPSGHSGQHYHRHPKRIVLVKNNDPTVRRSIILSRRTARSLRVFMDEISELMQCHVRKLYTLDGRKIDSIQSLMQCPNVLVCVGREPFKPLLLENLRKPSEEKLPGMVTRSRSSIFSEGHESKKNVNFGLETKKSIIHPRSDSSNRSTRFSLSSEKSYPNGLCMTPGQMGYVSTCPYTKEVILNDDIEKRVLVNKDGSLSVEMKVRFRLVNDETLQWSTEIKKSATTSNESSSVKDGDAQYLQGKAEYSDPEFNSACEAEEACVPKFRSKHLQGSHCQNCCNHRQDYDIWKNPMHKDSGVNGASNSCSSSGSSHKIMHKKASVDSIRTISRSSEEYTEHVVEKASCFQQTVEEGDTRVEYCSISRCCSHSEMSGSVTKSKSKRSNEDTCETNIVNICHHSGINELGAFEIPKLTEERPISAVSNSSKVLESLKEDQDDDYDDLPPSASRASEWSQSNSLEPEKQITCVHCCGSQASQNCYLSPRPPSKVSSCSAHSPKHKKYKSMYQTPDSARSSASKVSSRSPSCQCGAVTADSAAAEMQNGLEERPITVSDDSIVPNKSRARNDSSRAEVSDVHSAQTVYEDGTENELRCKSDVSVNTGVSGKSGNSTACPFCGGCKRSVKAASRLSENPQESQAQEADQDIEIKSVEGRSSMSHRSEASIKSKRSHKCTQGTVPVSNVPDNSGHVQNKLEDADVLQCRSESALSALSNASATSKQSNRSNRTACGRASDAGSMTSEIYVVEDKEERIKSAMSVKSNASARSKTNSVIPDEVSTSALANHKAEDVYQEERAISSRKSNRSSKSRSSQKSRCSNAERAIIPACHNSDISTKIAPDKESERGESPLSTASASPGQEPEIMQEPRMDSAMSIQSNSSSKHPSFMSTSGKSAKSQDDIVEKDVSPVPEKKFDQDPGTTTKERVASRMSNTSKKSMKSNASSINLQLGQENNASSELSKAQDVAAQASDVESGERTPSAMSAEKQSHKSESNIPGIATTSEPNLSSLVAEKCQESIESERPSSALSKNSEVSVKSNACSERTSKSTEDTKNVQNTLSVNSPSPIKKKKKVPIPKTPTSDITIGSNNRAPSGISVSSKASSKSTKSNKCNCSSNSNLKETNSKIPSVNERNVMRATSSKSAKSPTASPYPQSDEPLSPVSTVSLGLVEEDKFDDLNETSINSTSQILEENKSPLERASPEPAVADHLDSSEVMQKERTKTSTSLSSTISKNSKKSHISQNLCKSGERALSPASLGKPESGISSKSKAEIDDANQRVPSALSAKHLCSKSPSKASRPSEINLTTKKSKSTPQAVLKNNNSVDQTDNVSTISGSSSKCGQSKIASGKVTPTGSSQPKDKGTANVKNNSSSTLQIKGSKAESDCNSKASSVKSLKTFQSDKGIEQKEEHSLSVIPQNCPDPTHDRANKNMMPVIHLDSNDSVLSNALSAAALLREKVGNARSSQDSRESGTNPSNKDCDLGETIDVGSKCEKRSTSKQRKCSTSSLAKNEDQGLELMLSNLPNASPTEVINDWLKNIPTKGPMYELEDELDMQHREQVSEICERAVKEEEESLQNKTEDVPEIGTEMNKPEEIELVAVEDPDKEDNNTICDLTETGNETGEVPVAPTIGPGPKLKERQDLPKRCHSSVQVMKVLLSPKMDRCNSLPEVSAVYGQKLSTSAKGLLDCLANLQLIDSDPKTGNDDKYNEIISILQSLWIYAPNESEQDQHKKKGNCSAEDEFNPRSSSGVDVSSGSLGSGKGSFNEGVVKLVKDRVAPFNEHEALEIPEDIVKEVEDDPSCATPESTEPSHVPLDALTPDIAERVRCSPEVEKLGEEQQVHEVLQATEEVIQSTDETNRDEFSNQSSGNNSNDLKSQADKETDPPENLETSSSLKKSVLSRRVSQDPDPVWVLSLLKKLEKQFMSHYANAMAEFKVKWDLDDSDMLDKMISELKEEVQKRIQSSINRELQKIQCRAGWAPRPPKNSMSRESTVQTEQRRRRLKVMKNKSVSPSLSKSEELNNTSGTDVSDQRSDDEYCPCEKCMKKKMESRAVQRGEALSLAPVMKDFDLRKILETKKVPLGKKLEEPKKVSTQCSDSQDQSNLDVVHEESEVQNQTDDGKVTEEKGTTDATQAKEDMEEGLADDGTSVGHAVEDGESDVEGGKAKEGKEQDTDNKEEETEKKEDTVAVDDGEAENTKDREEAKEDDPTEEEATETANSEYGDEEQTPKDEETRKEAGEAEEEAKETEEQLETVEKGEETESAIDHKKSGGKSGKIESNTNDMVDTCEGEENGEVDTTTIDKSEIPGECDEDRNQGTSTQAEDDTKDEDQGNTCSQPNETEKEGHQVSSLRASGDNTEQAEVEDCGIKENHQDDIEAKSIDDAENQTENPEDRSEKEDKNKKDSSAEQFNSDCIEANGSGQASDEDSGLLKQLTKTSVESQPGSMENAMGQKVQMKLNDIRSFMESSESQDDSIVVITKQSPFTERRNMSSRHGNKEEVENEVIEWQVSPKRRNRSPARANKLRRPKDSDVKVDDLEY